MNHARKKTTPQKRGQKDFWGSGKKGGVKKKGLKGSKHSITTRSRRKIDLKKGEKKFGWTSPCWEKRAQNGWPSGFKGRG